MYHFLNFLIKHSNNLKQELKLFKLRSQYARVIISVLNSKPSVWLETMIFNVCYRMGWGQYDFGGAYYVSLSLSSYLNHHDMRFFLDDDDVCIVDFEYRERLNPITKLRHSYWAIESDSEEARVEIWDLLNGFSMD